jgi:hypothetical protein
VRCTRIGPEFLFTLLALTMLLSVVESTKKSPAGPTHIPDVGHKPAVVRDRSVHVFDVGHKPVKIHDSSGGWAEYPSLAATPGSLAVAYSFGKEGRSQVYYHVINRETWTSGGGVPSSALMIMASGRPSTSWARAVHG